MANFLINTPSSETSGTLTADLFVLSTANEVTTFGLDGADTITANATVAVSALKLNAGKGADTINLSGNQVLSQVSVFAGAGHDTLNIDNQLNSSVARAGQGNDTIFFSGVFNDSTLNGNDLADVISAQIDGGSTTSLLAAGKGSDTIRLAVGTGTQEISLNGGAGHDTIEVSAVGTNINLSSFALAGGAGKDTITLDDNAVISLSGQFSIDGGSQADLLTIGSGMVGLISDATSTIAGGSGADTIIFSGGYTNSAGIVDGGAGADSIWVETANAGTIAGGAGLDSITIGGFASASGDAAVHGGFLVGGSEADTFSLGSGYMEIAQGSGSTALDNGNVIRYGSFSDSTLSNLDTVSANVTLGHNSGVNTGSTLDANLFRVSQSLVTFSAAGGANNQFTGTLGKAIFTSTFSESVTARVASLDTQTGKGTVAYFEAENGDTDYLFVQGGAANGGTSDDLVIKLNTAADKITAYSNSSIGIVVQSAMT